MRWWLFLLALAAVILRTAPAFAETVFLTHAGRSGVGWLFLDFDMTCRVATPRHVVTGPDGKLLTPDMIEANGRQTATRHPVGADDPDMDLAFLEAAPIVASSGCSTSRLSRQPLDTVVNRMERGVLAIATLVDQQRVQVAPVALSRDEHGGRVIAITPVPGEENFKEGMSGGVVFVEGRPVAMLYHVLTEEGVGLAYRFDAIYAEKSAAVDTTPSSSSSDVNANVRDVAIVAGKVNDGSVNAFLDAAETLELLPDQRRVVLTVDLDIERSITGVTLAAPENQELNLHGVIVEAGTGGGTMAYARNCDAQPKASSVLCSLAPRRTARLRLTLVTDDAGPPIRIRSLRVLAE